MGRPKCLRVDNTDHDFTVSGFEGTCIERATDRVGWRGIVGRGFRL